MELLGVDHRDPLPITTYCTKLQQALSESSSDSERVRLIHDVERIFRGGDGVTPLLPSSAGQLSESRLAYKSLVCSLIGCAALPDCEDDCASLPPSAYRDVPARAAAVCSALAALLGLLRRGGARTELLLAVAPDVCVFAVTHFQVSARGRRCRKCESLRS